MSGRRQRGFTIIELLVALAVASLVLTGLASSLIENARINKAQQLRVQTQAGGRTTMAFVVKQLRSAGWDPTGSGFAAVALDADITDGDETIDLFFDNNADGDTSDAGEQIRIRHTGTRVEWRQGPTDPWETIGINITNDADLDGTPERMFTPSPAVDPTRLTVTLTASSGAVDPVSGEVARYTLTSDVTLRNNR